MVNIIQGNWGYSFLYGLPVLAVIEEKLRWTLVILFPPPSSPSSSGWPLEPILGG